jgi:cytochrome P450
VLKTARPDLFEAGLFDGTAFYDAFAWYRRHEPISWQSLGDDGFWSVTRYEDVVSVHRDTRRMSSTSGMRLGSEPGAVAAVADRMLIVSDPPAHTRMKRTLIQPFSAAMLDRAEQHVNAVVARVVHRALGEDGDVMRRLKRIPTDVIAAIMQLPPSDWEWIGDTTTQAFEAPDERVRLSANSEIFTYFYDLVAKTRSGGTNQFVAGLLADTTREGHPCVSDEELVFNLSGVLAGGNETTRYTLAALTLELARRPDQWRRVRDGKVDLRLTTEEALRWSVPGMHVMRTAAEPTRLGDVEIEAGQRVVTWIGSANRDESIFTRPDEFDAGRHDNRHLTFGAGRHLCLGSRLARLEITAYLETLRASVDRLHLTGDPHYNGSNFTWGIDRLPLRLEPRRNVSADNGPRRK